MPLSDMENCAIGIICGVSDTTLLQSTNYYKTASQARLPFTLSPQTLYRGYTVNTISNAFGVMSQFFLNGVVTKLITGGSQRPLDNSEKIFAGVSAGALSSLIGGPLELVMVQQQTKGGSLIATAGSVFSEGSKTIFRGTSGMMMREGIYCGGYLGVLPVVRDEVQRRYPGLTTDQARLCATFIAGPICSFSSHPPDTLKTVLQGDIERVRYFSYSQAAKTIIVERGTAALWAGLPWRVLRQFIAVFLFDKIRSDFAPLIFPHAFID